MAKSIKGNGELRASIYECGRRLWAVAMEYEKLLFENEATTRNNLNFDISVEQKTALFDITRICNRSMAVVEKAIEHHSRQNSVLPNTVFGQRRRKERDGSIKVIDPPDAATMADAMAKYEWQYMTENEKHHFMIRGSDPHPDFYKWPTHQQREYLRGGLGGDAYKLTVDQPLEEDIDHNPNRVDRDKAFNE